MENNKAVLPKDLQWNFEMPTTKLNGFKKQFPWVSKFINGKVNQVYVSRVDPHVLDIIPETEDIGSILPEWSCDTILLLDGCGDLVTGQIEGTRRRYVLFGEMVSHTFSICAKAKEGQSIGGTLTSIGKHANKVRFILLYSMKKNAVILYKSPKDIPMLEWIQQQVNEESEKYKKIINEIDAEAE